VVFHARTKENKEVKYVMTIEKEIEALNYITHQLEYGYIDLGSHDEDELEVVEKAINKQIPKKPIHIHEEYAEHGWMHDKNGKIDTWAWDAGFHNGPMCTRCFHSECEHCNPKWETEPEEPCVVDEDVCPSCNNTIAVVGKFCINCGQALDWS
jgi:hypothetical protein